MDITLERILSLIPKKPDGKFVHGAFSAFARDLGFKDGHIVSDWIAGNTTSYLNYLYEISEKYNVSVDWLKGETETKEKPAPMNEDGIEQAIIQRLCGEDQEKIQLLLDALSKNPEKTKAKFDLFLATL